MKEKLKSVNPILVLLSLFVGRLIVLGSSIPEALVVMSLCGLIAGLQYIKDKKENRLNDDMYTDLTDQIGKLRDSVGASSLASAMQPSRKNRNLI